MVEMKCGTATIGLAKIITIEAVEREWVELLAAVHPMYVEQLKSSFFRLVAPVSNVLLPPICAFWYRASLFSLPCVLADSGVARVASVDDGAPADLLRSIFED